MRLEDLQVGAQVRGLVPDGLATVKSVEWFGDHAVEVIFRDSAGRLDNRLLSRDDEACLELAQVGRPWSFDGDGDLLRLVSEAYRIHLAWLFDPYLAVSTSVIEPLPHQISAVYEEMLPRQPMRFLLADDPGAGKTIMAGLLIKELMVRGDLARCLIVSPGSLVEQWQDELAEKFGLHFDILTRDMIEAARTANPFEHKNLLIARLDQLSRNEDIQERLKNALDYDLVVCDEAHKMSAHFLGSQIKETKRYRLGQVLGEQARNFLLMTATPHNGKEEDFQLFLGLLDADRFEGRFRDGVHTHDTSDLMRRMVKEELFFFDGRKLFPERKSYTAQYDLSDEEAELYNAVTNYVRDEMNRVQRLSAARRVNVGFALQTLQRRLASSPESIYKSIKRRIERLERRLEEARLLSRGVAIAEARLEQPDLPAIDQEDLDEATQDELDAIEDELLDNATAAQTVGELETEIQMLKQLEALAKNVRNSGQDAKWNELNSILDHPLMFREDRTRRKMVIFTEFLDTLTYLAGRIRTRLGDSAAVVEIHGQVGRQDRRKVVEKFMNDPTTLILVANDAAGEGVNLQRAHLMVNYDLPWNPNRLEQRFGRIHRIGQREVCHLWNLVAKDTREGAVYTRLLDKLEAERAALDDKVFDVLGQLFEAKPLRELLVEAIRYGDDPARKDELDRAVEGAVDRAHIEEVLQRRALVHRGMDVTRVEAIREEMERAHARRLQPHFIRSFFLEAFGRLGGKIHRREEGRYEITHVPSAVRQRDRAIGEGAPVGERYERVCFEKAHADGPPRAELICPGHSLLDATIDLVMERHRDLLKRGAVLIDDSDFGDGPRVLFYLEHQVLDGRRTARGDLHVVSQRLQFVEVDKEGKFTDAGTAPYLDYRPASEGELAVLRPETEAEWLKTEWDHRVINWAIQNVVPNHVSEVKGGRLPVIDKVEAEVKARLLKEINYWDSRAQRLKDQERAGKKTRLPAHVAESRADRLNDRLQARLADLAKERSITSSPPRVQGGALIIPIGLVLRLRGDADGVVLDPFEAHRIDKLAMSAVMAAERRLGRNPVDVHLQPGLGYDIESRQLDGKDPLFIEVKGITGDHDVVIRRSQILCSLNEPERFRLAIVRIDGDEVAEPVYVQGYDFGQPGFEQTTATFRVSSLLRYGGPPV